MNSGPNVQPTSNTLRAKCSCHYQYRILPKTVSSKQTYSEDLGGTCRLISWSDIFLSKRHHHEGHILQRSSLNSVQQDNHHKWYVRVRVQSSYFSWNTGRRNQLVTSWCPLQFFFSQLTFWCWQTWRCWPTNSPGDQPHFQLISVQSILYPSGRIAKQHDWTTSSKGMKKLLLRRKASMRNP